MKRRLTPLEREARVRRIPPLRKLVILRASIRVGGETISVPRLRFLTPGASRSVDGAR